MTPTRLSPAVLSATLAGVGRPRSGGLLGYAKVGVTAVALAYLAACGWAGGRNTIDPYDGTYNTRLAQNLAESGRFGLMSFQTFVWWPVEVTTGPTVLVPIAAAYRVVGQGPFVANLVCAALVVATVAACLATLVVPLRTGRGLASVAVAGVVTASVTAKYHHLYWSPLGDTLAGLVLLLGTLLTFRPGSTAPSWGRALAAGLVVGSAVYVKFMAVMPATVLGGYLLMATACGRGRWRDLAAWVGGAAAVAVLWEGTTLVTLGSADAYVSHMREFVAFVRQNGTAAGTVPRSAGVWAVAARQWVMYFDHLGWFAPLTLVPLAAVPWAMARGLLRADAAAARVAAALGLQAAAVMGWWFFLSGSPYVRHLMPAMVMLPFVAHFLLLPRGDYGDAPDPAAARRPKPWAYLATGAALLAAWAASPAGVVRPPRPAAEMDARTKMLFAFAGWLQEFRAAHPDARFWGAGWWRNWDVQTLTGVGLHDIHDPAENPGADGGPDDFLMVSDVFNWEKNETTTKFLADCRNTVAYQNPYFTLYRIPRSSERPSVPPTEVLQYAPRTLKPGEAFCPQPGGCNGMWLKLATPVPAGTVARWNGTPLQTNMSDDRLLVTALVPEAFTAAATQAEVELFDRGSRTTVAKVPVWVERP